MVIMVWWSGVVAVDGVTVCDDVAVSGCIAWCKSFTSMPAVADCNNSTHVNSHPTQCFFMAKL